jgi:hypothetical protein
MIAGPGKMPTTSVLRRCCLLGRSLGLELQTCRQISRGTLVSKVAHVVRAASLPAGARQRGGDRGDQAGVGVGGDQHDAGQAAGDQAAEERQPSRAVLGTGDVQAQDLPLAVSLGWQYMLLAGLREMSGEIAAAAAALATAGLF